MRFQYFTNFIVNAKTKKVIMALDYDKSSEALRGFMEFQGIDGIAVERVGPLSDAPLFETPGEWEPAAITNRVAY